MIRLLKIVFLIVALMGVAPSAIAQEKEIDYSAFAQWPVLHGGRIKTMESFARATLYQISGKTSLPDQTAIEWLATTLFNPLAAITTPAISSGQQNVLNLPESTNNLYTLNQMIEAMRPHQDLVIALSTTDPSTLSAPQKDMLRIYQSLITYTQLIQSFSAVLPLKGGQGSYLDGGGSYTQAIVINEGGKNNNLLRLIPNDHPQYPLISIWESIQQDKQSPVINNLKTMALAWNEDNYEEWSNQSFLVLSELKKASSTHFTLILEHYYVTYQPIYWVIGLYIAGIILTVVNRNKYAFYIFITGTSIHILTLIMRGIILQRPPTGTLYETLLFSAAIIALFSIILYRYRQNNILIAGLFACAAFLLFIGQGFIQGDSLTVLVAVLNTNFWLSTHVTCIIIGYAFCIITAMCGHLTLALPLEKSNQMAVFLTPLALTALLFTSVGTLLGGIWADQSWGRFWGWDPKENGALLIVLWLAWVLHGRLSGHFGKTGYAAALGLTTIMVALTWFGVNLLGVGLHSYGFISGIAIGLVSFCTFQIILIIGLIFLHKRRITNAT